LRASPENTAASVAAGVFSEKICARPGTEDIEGERRERRLCDRAAKSECAFRRGEGGDEAAASSERSRKRAEVEARNDGECAERADEELVEVVAGDGF